MQSENIKATYEWLRERGFMATEEQTCDLLVANRGREDGAAAGSWVIDGNTSDDTCRAILEEMENCAWDGPELQLGQWADDPSFAEILADIGVTCDDDSEDDLWIVYSDAWYEGLHNEVERACLARVTPDVTQTAATVDE